MNHDITLEEVEASIREVWNNDGATEISERSKEVLKYVEERMRSINREDTTPEVTVNKHGINTKIKAHILSDEEMRKVGFHKNYYEGTDHEQYSPYWFWHSMIKFPDEKQFRGFEISINIQIPKDGSDIRIDILDDDFCQPYDYQNILSITPGHRTANIVREQVETWMEYFQDVGILSGHVYGEYI